MSSNIQQAKLYSYDAAKWRTYDIAKLDKNQCDIVDRTCRSEATYSRYQVIGLIVVSIAAAALIGVAAIVSASLGRAFLLGLIGKIEVIGGYSLSKGVYLAADLFVKVGVFIFAAFSLGNLWDFTKAHVQDNWNYGAHLDQQAKDALLFKATLEKPAPIV